MVASPLWSLSPNLRGANKGLSSVIYMTAILGLQGPMVFVSLRQSIYHTVLSSAPLHKRLNILKLNCVAVHEKAGERSWPSG